MISFAWNAAPGQAPGVALLFGTGLIGSAVTTSLSRRTGAVANQMNWSWNDLGRADAPTVECAAVQALEARPGGRLAVIWAAGRSGFGTDTAGMARETSAFSSVLDSIHRIKACIPEAPVDLHLVSSAGGLFEGQTNCGPDAIPLALRPYGEGKMAQERMLNDVDVCATRRIYRPSSVYGLARNGRRGLIPALMIAARTRAPARIMGALTTQRDYIHADDVGTHIAARVLDPGPEAVSTDLLAQARPATIFEVLKLVEEQMGLPILRQLEPRPENALNNTFLRAALPHRFWPTPISEGIARTASVLVSEAKPAVQ